MFDWGIFVATYLAATVEWVEAFTIVLAVSMSIGWPRATGAAATALLVLAAMTAATGGVLHLGLEMPWLQLVIGIFLLLFGLRWLAKAVARQAGLKAMHDEDEEFAETREALARGDRHAAWLIAFKAVDRWKTTTKKQRAVSMQPWDRWTICSPTFWNCRLWRRTGCAPTSRPLP